MNKTSRILLILVVLAGLGWGGAWYFTRASSRETPFRTVPVQRGNLVATISATGTVEPEEVIDVGAQVAGQINVFGKDESGATIDYGSEIKEGTVLAKIDDLLYAADAAAARSQVAQAKAGVQRAEADLIQMKANQHKAAADWERAKQAGVGNGGVLSQEAYDTYKAAAETAAANVKVGEAAIEQAKGSVAQAEAQVKRAERNLGYCTIKSPVDGVIIDRRVNIGQTVVASLNAPSLFLIAKDLKKMEVWVAVNEADIGSIRAGQPVTFTVDAFPGETFKGQVRKIRLNATMTQNVVTYTVEVSTDNSSGKLLPYLTANVQFEVSRHDDVLMVPNAALRWTPQPDQLAADASAEATTQRSGRGSGRGGNRGGDVKSGTVYALAGDRVRPIRVKLGATDGTSTIVDSDKLAEGAEIVIGENVRAEAAPQQGTNPFAPQPMRGRRSQ